jgi:glycosyltransferase involved in cell wall biosynthesis
MSKEISIILPARNEGSSLDTLLPDIISKFPEAEIIVVNDYSNDSTEEVCKKNHVKIVNRPYQMGNGAAIKAGARAATGEVLVFMDADGQHQPVDIQTLLDGIEKGFDMVVGTRCNKAQASIFRLIANNLYNFLASWITSHTIKDLTSGFRAVDAKKFKEFLHLLPNGFSYPTTITMAFFRTGYSVLYEHVNVQHRTGNSHIHPLKDGIGFLLIIFKIGTLYSPLKFFAPISFIIFSTGVIYYLYTFLTQTRFTNMSALLFTTSMLVFFIGIVSEQLTMLFYRDKQTID